MSAEVGATASEVGAALQAETDLVAEIVAGMDSDHRWVAALVSRAFRTAVRLTGRCSTTAAGALTSLARYELALECGCPWRRERFTAPIDHALTSAEKYEILDRMCALSAFVARSGDVALLARLRAEGCVWDASTCAAAAEAGALGMLQWARANRCYWDMTTAALAALSGHMHVLRWAHANGCTISASLTYKYAAGSGRMEVLEWLLSIGLRADANACAAAAASGHLHVLRWLREHDCPWSHRTCTAAAGNGHLGVLKWARAHDCPWDAETCGVAAHGQHASVVRWAVDNGCPVSRDALLCRGSSRWLVENGHVAADNSACWSAAYSGDLPLLQWLISRGCLLHGMIIASAASGGHLEILKWAREEGCPWPHTIQVDIRHTETIEWLVCFSDFPTRQLRIIFHDTDGCPETLQLLRNAQVTVLT